MSDACEAVQVMDRAHQIGEVGVLRARRDRRLVLAVGLDRLPQQRDLAHAAIEVRLDLATDLVDRAAAFAAAICSGATSASGVVTETRSRPWPSSVTRTFFSRGRMDAHKGRPASIFGLAPAAE